MVWPSLSICSSLVPRLRLIIILKTLLQSLLIDAVASEYVVLQSRPLCSSSLFFVSGWKQKLKSHPICLHSALTCSRNLTTFWEITNDGQWHPVSILFILFRYSAVRETTTFSTFLFYFRSPLGNHSTVCNWLSFDWLHLDQCLSYHFGAFSNCAEVGSNHDLYTTIRKVQFMLEEERGFPCGQLANLP